MVQKLRVAIIGAGIGGLTLASWIAEMDKQKRIEVDIYEAAAELSEIGAGIHLWPRSFKMLAKVGLEEEVLRFCERANEDSSIAFQFRKSDQEKGQHIFDMSIKGAAIKIHRADLQKILLKRALTHARLHLSSKLVSYTEHLDSVHLEFENDSTQTCDLLVGADGIRSITRRLFLASQIGDGYQESIDPVWTGTYAYRGIIPRDELLKKIPGHRVTRAPVMYIGKQKHVVTYSMANGEFINFVGLVHDETREDTCHKEPQVTTVSKSELLSVFQGFEPEVQALLECIPNPSRWAIHHLKPPKRYAERRILLLGDAAHAMSPHQANGAGQAMEDAYILSRLLADPGTTDVRSQIPIITCIYDAIRRPAGNTALMVAKTCGKLTGLTDDEKELPEVKAYDDTVPHDVLVAYIKKMERSRQMIWDASALVDGQCQDALKLLRSLRKPAAMQVQARL